MILLNKTYFYNKLSGSNRKINSTKTKHKLVENVLNELWEKVKLLLIKGYSFLLGRIYFTINDGSQNMFVCKSILSTIKQQYTILKY